MTRHTDRHRRSQWVRRHRSLRRFQPVFQALERRELLTGELPVLSGLHLVSHTGPPGDSTTVDARVGGTVTPPTSGGSLAIAVDTNWDGVPESTVGVSAGSFQDDVGPLIQRGWATVRLRPIVQATGSTSEIDGNWTTFSFNYAPPLSTEGLALGQAALAGFEYYAAWDWAEATTFHWLDNRFDTYDDYYYYNNYSRYSDADGDILQYDNYAYDYYGQPAITGYIPQVGYVSLNYNPDQGCYESSSRDIRARMTGSGPGSTIELLLPRQRVGLSAYQATIDWGDGTTSPGQFIQDATSVPGTYVPVRVMGDHTYQVPGTYQASVTVSGPGGLYDSGGQIAFGPQLVATVPVTIVPQTLAVQPVTIRAVHGSDFSGTAAHFTDQLSGDAFDYSATIVWGDGYSSGGWIQPDGHGGYNVVANHTYQVTGTFNTSVTIRRDAGATLQAPAGQATVDAVAPMVATVGVSTSDQTLANFNYYAAATYDWSQGRVFTWSGTSTNDYYFYGAFTSSDGATLYGSGYGGWLWSLYGNIPGHGSVSLENYGDNTYMSWDGRFRAQLDGDIRTGATLTLIDTQEHVELASYSATIDWGDGNRSAGRLVENYTPSLGELGTARVVGDHIYAQPGDYRVQVTITGAHGIYDDYGSYSYGPQLVAYDTMRVVPQTLAVQPIAARAVHGVYYSGPAAHFTDQLPGGPGDYSVSIWWGDGSASGGWVQSDGHGGFDVIGGHTYQVAGTLPTTILIRRNAGATLQASAGQVTIEAVAPTVATVGVPIDDQTMANFNYYAEPIYDWSKGEVFTWWRGDNNSASFQSSDGGWLQAYGSGTNIWNLSGTLGRSGEYVSMDIDYNGHLRSWDGRFEAEFSGVFGPGATVKVLDGQDHVRLKDFSATIDWGDGTQSQGQLVENSVASVYQWGTARVVGDHTYAQPGDYAVQVTIAGPGVYDGGGSYYYGTQYVARSSIKVVPQTLTVQPVAISSVHGAYFSGTAAHFIDQLPGDANDYSATIWWGDGYASSGWIQSDGHGGYNVIGGHTYNATGTFPTSVLVRRDAGATLRAPAGQATVEAAALTAATVGIATGEQTLANFNYWAAPVYDWTVGEIFTWAGGSASQGYFTSSDGGWLQAYGYGGEIWNLQGSMGRSGEYVSFDPDYDHRYFRSWDGRFEAEFSGTFGPGATVKVLDGQDHVRLRDFAATIDWGDGTQSAGRLVEDYAASIYEFGTARVVGDHSYAQPGNYVVQVTIAGPYGVYDDDGRHSYGTQYVARSTQKVVAQSITITPATPVVIKREWFNGTVATFIDTDTAGASAGYQATIWWGDGSPPSSGQVESRPDGTYAVRGSHLYGHEGQFAARVLVRRNGGANNSANIPLTVWGATPIDAIANLPLDNAELTSFEFFAGWDWAFATHYSYVTVTGNSDPYDYYNNYADFEYQAGDGSTLTLHTEFYSYYSRYIFGQVPGLGWVNLSYNDYTGNYESYDGSVIARVALSSGGSYWGLEPGPDTILQVLGPDSRLDVSNFSATVDWGDGTSGPATLETVDDPMGSGSPTYVRTRVLGNHAYVTPGSYTLTVHVNGPGNVYDDDGRYQYGPTLVSPLPVTVSAAVADDAYSTHFNRTLSAGGWWWYGNQPGVLDNDPVRGGGRTVSVSLVPGQGPAHGQLTLNADGSFQYTSDHNYTGLDSFVYDVLVNSAYHFQATARISVLDDTPTASPYEFSLLHDRAFSGNVSTKDVDPNGDPLTYSLQAGPSHGSVQVQMDGRFVYTPGARFVGDDSFTYTVSDGPYSAQATVTLHVNDHAPAVDAIDVSISHDRNATLALAPYVHDADGDSLTYSLVTPPASGTLTLDAAGRMAYTPVSGFTGNVTFTFSVDDGALSTTTTATLHVVNRAPTVDPIDVSLPHDRYTTLPLSTFVHDADGDSLTYALASGPADGTVTVDTWGRATYSPPPGFAGDASFSFNVSDGAATTTATAWIHVTNHVPVANDDTYTSIVHSRPFSFNPLANDQEQDGDRLRPSVTTAPGHGRLTILSSGQFQYTPDALYVGPDSFTYQVSDGVAWSADATVYLLVTNQAPVADNDGVQQTFTVSHDQMMKVTGSGILSNDRDADGDVMQVVIVTLPEHGQLFMHDDGSFVYFPDAGYVSPPGEPDAFTYQVTDGIDTSAVVTVGLNTINQVPVLQNAQFAGVHDRPLVANVITKSAFLGGPVGRDPDGDPFTVRVLSQPAHGSLILRPTGEFVYSPPSGYTGPDTFTYVANDGLGDSLPATVTINVVETAPVATDDHFSIRHDSRLDMSVRDLSTWWNWMDWWNRLGGYAGSLLDHATDAEQDRLTIRVQTGVAHGTLSFDSDGSFHYIPARAWSGTDAFTYVVSDGLLESSPATVTIDVKQTPPHATRQSVSTGHDRPVSIPLYGSDDEGDSLTFEVVDQPAHGTVTLGNGGVATYRPAQGYLNGTDAFTYRVFDGSSFSAPALVQITVSETAPAAPSGTVTLSHDRPGTWTIPRYYYYFDNSSTWNGYAYDAENDALTFTLVGAGLPGLSFQQGGSFTYVPAAGFRGSVSFQYQVSDGILSKVGTVTINVVDRPPQLMFPTTNIKVGFNALGAPRVATGTLASDPDGDALALSIERVDGTMQGTFTQIGTMYQYKPDGNEAGTETFAMTASDGYNPPVQQFIVFEAVESPPVASDRTFSVSRHGSISASPFNSSLLYYFYNSLFASDPDGDTIRGTLVHGPAHSDGTFSFSADGSFTYRPASGFIGTDSFQYRVTDGILESNVATVTLNVVNTAPSIFAPRTEFFARPVGAVMIPVSAADSDPLDSASLTLSVSQAPVHGSVVYDPAQGRLVYTPNAGFEGTDSLAVIANDGLLSSDPVRINIHLTVSAAPLALGDAYTVQHDHQLAADSTGVGQWSMIDAAKSWWRSVDGRVLANDIDGDGDKLTAQLVTQPAHGTLEFSADGTFSYIPDAGYVGPDSFTYVANDGQGTSQPATVTLNVTNTATPTSHDDAYQVQPGQTLKVAGTPIGVVVSGAQTGRVLRLNDPVHFGEATLAQYIGLDRLNPDWRFLLDYAPSLLDNDVDPDADALDAVLLAGPAHGVLHLEDDGSFTYTPNAGFTGTDSFTYRATDGILWSDVATATITISNTSPTVRRDQVYSVERGETLTVRAGQFDYLGIGNSLRSVLRDDETTNISVALVTGPAHGQLVLEQDGSFVYTPAAGFVGDDEFWFRGNDGISDSPAGRAVIHVTNATPVAPGNREYKLGRNGSLSGQVPAGTDADGDVVTARLVGGPFHGSFTLAPNGSFVYTPAAGFIGADVVALTYSDGDVESGFTLLTFSVEKHAPTATADRFAIVAGAGAVTPAQSLLANDIESEGDPLAAALVSPPAHGQLTLQANGTFTYTPAAGFFGIDQFSYKANDGWSDSLPAVVTLVVQPGSFGNLGLSLIERQPYSGQVASFVHPDSQQTAAGLKVTIDWGDGSLTSQGAVTGSAGSFTISGAHTYNSPGTYRRTITIVDSAGRSSESTAVVTVADALPTIAPSQLTVAKGAPNASLTVATFADGNGLAPGDYRARINWGDGTSSDGIITSTFGLGTGPSYTVSGGHRYAETGTYPVTVTLTLPDGQTISAVGQARATVQVVVTPRPISVAADGTVDGVLASFTSTDPTAFAEEFFALISWGDGMQSLGSVVTVDGKFSVYGRHRYAGNGTYTVTVAVTGDDPGPGQAEFTVSEDAEVMLDWAGNNIVLDEDRLPSQDLELAWFTDPEGNTDPTVYTATVTWENNQTTTATIRSESGRFVVVAMPPAPYEEEGAYTATIDIEQDGEVLDTLVASVLVRGLELDLDTPLITFAPTPKDRSKPFDGAIATFSDQDDPNGEASDYRAEIDWSDNQFTTGTIKKVSGGYEIRTSRSFSHDGDYHAHVYLYEGDRSRASGTVTVSVTLPGRDNDDDGSGGGNGGGGVIPLQDISQSGCPDMFVLDPGSGTGSGSGGGGGGGGNNNGPPTVDDISLHVDALTVRDGNSLLVEQQSYSGLKLAHFDGNGSLAGFKVEIDWGDATGKVAGSISGNDVVGDHEYDSFGRYTVTVRIYNDTKDAKGFPVDGRVFTITTGAYVDAPALTLTAGAALSAVAGQAMTNQSLATLTSGEHAIGVVEWGDGKLTEIGGADAAFAGGGIQGTHKYDQPGNYVARITVKEGTHLEVATVAITVSAASATGLSFTLAPIPTATERTALTNVLLATVTDPDYATSGTSQIVTVDWGDGVIEPAKVTAAAGGAYEIRGTHTYSEAGAKALKIDYAAKYEADGVKTDRKLDFGGTVIVGAPAITPSSSAIFPSGEPEVVAGRTVDNAVLATFHVAATPKLPRDRDFVAYIDWGDGTRSETAPQRPVLQTAVVGGGLDYVVYGTHAYPGTGHYEATIVIVDTTTATQSVVVKTPIHIVDGVAGVRRSYETGTFKITNGPVEGLSIDWGDGTSVDLGGRYSGTYTVSATHRYAEPGEYDVHTTLGGKEVTRTIVVAGGDVQMPDFVTVHATPNQEQTGVPLAVFSSTDFNVVDSTFTAKVNWGDGDWTDGVISRNDDGTFLVSSGSVPHKYKDARDYPITILLTSGDQTFVQTRNVDLETNLTFQASGPGEIDANMGTAEVMFVVEGEGASTYDGRPVTFYLRQGGVVVATAGAALDGGFALARFVLAPDQLVAGMKYDVEASFEGDTYNGGTAEVITGVADKLEWSIKQKDQDYVPLDGSSPVPISRVPGQKVAIRVLVKDKVGNVLKGAPVTWGDFNVNAGKSATGDPFAPRPFSDTAGAGEKADDNQSVTDDQGYAYFYLDAELVPPLYDVSVSVDALTQTRRIVGQQIHIVTGVTPDATINFAFPVARTLYAIVTDENGQPVSGVPVTFWDQKGLLGGLKSVSTGPDGRASVQVDLGLLSGLGYGLEVLGHDHYSAAVGSVVAQGSEQFIDISLPAGLASQVRVSMDRTVLAAGGQRATGTSGSPTYPSSYFTDAQATSFTHTAEDEYDEAETANLTDVPGAVTTVEPTAKLSLDNLDPAYYYRIVVLGDLPGNRRLIDLSNGDGNFAGGEVEFRPDANGHAEIIVRTTSAPVTDENGNVVIGKGPAIGLKLERTYIPLLPPILNFWTDVTVGSGSNSLSVIKPILVVDPMSLIRATQAINLAGRVVWGAIAGSDSLGPEMVGDIALGLAPVIGVYTDIRDLTKNLLRYLPLGLGEPDRKEMFIATCGILTEFLPPADYIADAYKAIYKLAKSSAQFAPLLVITEPLFEAALDAMWRWAKDEAKIFGDGVINTARAWAAFIAESGVAAVVGNAAAGSGPMTFAAGALNGSTNAANTVTPSMVRGFLENLQHLVTQPGVHLADLSKWMDFTNQIIANGGQNFFLVRRILAANVGTSMLTSMADLATKTDPKLLFGGLRKANAELRKLAATSGPFQRADIESMLAASLNTLRAASENGIRNDLASIMKNASIDDYGNLLADFGRMARRFVDGADDVMAKGLPRFADAVRHSVELKLFTDAHKIRMLMDDVAYTVENFDHLDVSAVSSLFREVLWKAKTPDMAHFARGIWFQFSAAAQAAKQGLLNPHSGVLDLNIPPTLTQIEEAAARGVKINPFTWFQLDMYNAATKDILDAKTLKWGLRATDRLKWQVRRHLDEVSDATGYIYVTNRGTTKPQFLQDMNNWLINTFPGRTINMHVIEIDDWLL